MAVRQFGWGGFGLRFLLAAILVFATYNPEGWSYFDWGLRHISEFSPLKALAGIVLVIGWVIYLRATMRSLGGLGILLAVALFGVMIWLVVDWGWVKPDNARTISYLLLVLISAVLAVGMSWSHVRRRLSGQADVDEVDED